MIKNIQECYDHIYSYVNLELTEKKYTSKTYSLDNIKNLVTAAGLDLNSFQFIHVAGTKGKGSVCFYLSAILSSLGYTTTSFHSPHILKPNERLLFGNRMITDDEMIDYTNKIDDILDKSGICPTTFEFWFLMYLLYSRDKKPDYLIVEVGLGGRLDTTNIITPLLSLITPISYDHVNVLGHTLEEIAYEKAGIIKENSPVITGLQKKNVLKILKMKAKEKNSQFYQLNQYFKIKSIQYKSDGIVFDFIYDHQKVNSFYLPMLGEHQIYNFLTALLGVLQIDGRIINELERWCDKIDRHANVDHMLKISGRIDVLKTNPHLIIDPAHNGDSAQKLVSALKNHYPQEKWLVLSGMVVDKDYDSFYKEIKEIASTLVITTPSQFKKSDVHAVFECAQKYIQNCSLIEDFNKACEHVLSLNINILITGSFYIVGPFMEYYNKYLRVKK